MSLRRNGTFTPFGGCDIIAVRYPTESMLNSGTILGEILGEVGAITWSPGDNTEYQGSLYFTCFDYPTTIESIIPPEKFWVRVQYINENGASSKVEFFNVKVKADRLVQGEPVRFTATHILIEGE